MLQQGEYSGTSQQGPITVTYTIAAAGGCGIVTANNISNNYSRSDGNDQLCRYALLYTLVVPHP